LTDVNEKTPRRIVQTEEWGPIPLSGSGALLSLSEASELLDKWQFSTGTEPEQYFELTPQHLTPKNWSGVISGRSIQLEVRPVGGANLSAADSAILDWNLGVMLEAAVTRRPFIFPDAELAGGGQRFHALIASFIEQLGDARRRQLIRRYRTTRAVTPNVCGRMIFPAQLLESIRRPGYFASEWVSLDEDTPENRFLKSVLVFSRPLTGGQLRARLEAQLVGLDRVGVPSDPRHEWERIRFDRLPSFYVAVLRLGKAILDGEAIGLFAGRYDSTSEIVFTARAFEHFVSTALEAAAHKIGYRAKVKENGYVGFWATGPNAGSRGVEMIPDVQLVPVEPGPPSIVIDTKWKRLRPDSNNVGINPSDVYQVVAYAARFGHHRAILLYPWVGTVSPATSGTRALPLDNSHFPLTIYIATVPMLDPGFGKLETGLTSLIVEATAA
jgi:5-methylcytosine-specific restriction enzyme subunit McrC